MNSEWSSSDFFFCGSVETFCGRTSELMISSGSGSHTVLLEFDLIELALISMMCVTAAAAAPAVDKQ